MSTIADLDNKVALVTGSARRIGRAIVRGLHDVGADVAIHYRGSGAEAESLAMELNDSRPDSAATFAADLTRLGDIDSLVANLEQWRDRLDILVNNASSFYPTPLGSITEEQWDDIIGSNLKAPLFLAQATLPMLRRSRGVIINMVDIHATRPLRDHAVYGPAKAGLAMLTRSLAKDLAPEIRVNGIAPGAILWPDDGMTEETRASILRQIPLGKPGSPADIAGAVLYLVRDARYVTGQIIAIDGGRSIGW